MSTFSLPLSLLQIITSGNFSYNDQTAKELMDMAHQGIKLLTSWTTAVMELVSKCFVMSVQVETDVCLCRWRQTFVCAGGDRHLSVQVETDICLCRV